eukprot:TRINITY_DN36736_c0_g1_i1.p1 TRINITY_DN36736_c0_g1~~TRINITY_DN36736_c0_g1_i1.p1  ORF type:complete len:126 (-),score=21.21 TRINITY_DN36736_c0_g1_i1:10-387(-)
MQLAMREWQIETKRRGPAPGRQQGQCHDRLWSDGVDRDDRQSRRAYDTAHRGNDFRRVRALLADRVGDCAAVRKTAATRGTAFNIKRSGAAGPFAPANPAGSLGLEIGRAVQQECRDRSRMPSSA